LKFVPFKKKLKQKRNNIKEKTKKIAKEKKVKEK
jgi:hypothetical protein